MHLSVLRNSFYLLSMCDGDDGKEEKRGGRRVRLGMSLCDRRPLDVASMARFVRGGRFYDCTIASSGR